MDSLGIAVVACYHIQSNYLPLTTPPPTGQISAPPLTSSVGSTTLTADADGVTTTDRRYTGQRAEGIGLYDYRARWYDPSLGRFAQADTIVPGMFNPMAYDRYAYVFNSPTGAVDSSGHFCVASKGGGQICSADDDVTVIPKRIWKTRSLLGTEDLDQSIDVVNTLDALEDLLGRPPTLAEILYMTAWTEYYGVEDEEVRDLGLEGLTRSLYRDCGGPSCSRNKLIKFLSGYQPWTGYKNVVDGDRYARANHLLNQLLGRLKNKATDPLWRDITNITLAKDVVLQKGWNYVEAHEIQQWYTVAGQIGPPIGATFGYASSDYAILGVLTTDGMFYMFTYCQTLHFHNNHTDSVCEQQ